MPGHGVFVILGRERGVRFLEWGLWGLEVRFDYGDPRAAKPQVADRRKVR